MADYHQGTLVESNPLVDIAGLMFLEDIADKQGDAGVVNYVIGLASSLAKSMPEEEYDTWEEFLTALRNRESILSTFEALFTPTDYCIVTSHCPFDDGVKEYIRKIGELPAIHKNIAEYFNYTRTPTTVNTCCVIHQAFRDFTSARIKVAGRRVKFAQICVANFGGRACSPDEWMPILLEKAKITKTKLNMVLRKNPCVWILYPGEKE